jgi:hypothetical protein
VYYEVRLTDVATSGGTTTWTYEVETGFGAKDLSHWVLGIDNTQAKWACLDEEDITTTSDIPTESEYGSDNSTNGMIGVKWNIKEDETAGMTRIMPVMVGPVVQTYTVSINSPSVTTGTVPVLVKGGTFYDQSLDGVAGPVCVTQ